MQFVPSGREDPKTADGFDWVSTAHDGATVPPSPFAEIAAEVHALCRVDGL